MIQFGISLCGSLDCHLFGHYALVCTFLLIGDFVACFSFERFFEWDIFRNTDIQRLMEGEPDFGVGAVIHKGDAFLLGVEA
jgi:hypothetical protein